jgi:hypothetical protein
MTPRRPCPQSSRPAEERRPKGPRSWKTAKGDPKGGDSWWRLAHGSTLTFDPGVSEALVTEFIRPAMRAVPEVMACQLGRCHISVVEKLGGGRLASQWTDTDLGLEITIAAGPEECPHDQHDVTLDLLLCLGQALWTKLNHNQYKAYWLFLDAEIGAGVPGEIDEVALKQKRLLLSGRYSASSRRRLNLYGAASFAGTAAEYVHCLWHDVILRSGRDVLPAAQLKRRLDLLSGWFPPARGHLLFPQASSQSEAGWISSSSRSSP